MKARHKIFDKSDMWIIKNEIPIPDWSKPGLTMTITGIVDQQRGGGN